MCDWRSKYGSERRSGGLIKHIGMCRAVVIFKSVVELSKDNVNVMLIAGMPWV